MPDLLTVTDEAHRIRKAAEAGPVGKRKTSFELYALLGDCMKLAVRCSAGPANAELRGLVCQQPTVGNRRYIETGSDEFTLVCRFVFAALKSKGAEHSNASRYAMALREAKKAGIRPEGLAAHLRDKGGINALFLNRPLAATTVSTKCIRLTRQITVHKGASVHLVLKRLPDNQFDVLQCQEIVNA